MLGVMIRIEWNRLQLRLKMKRIFPGWHKSKVRAQTANFLFILDTGPINFREPLSNLSWSFIIWLNIVISRSASANTITSFHQAAEAERRWLLLQRRVELHYDGLKIVDSVTEYIAFNIETVYWEIWPEMAAVWHLKVKNEHSCLLVKVQVRKLT